MYIHVFLECVSIKLINVEVEMNILKSVTRQGPFDYSKHHTIPVHNSVVIYDNCKTVFGETKCI